MTLLWSDKRILPQYAPAGSCELLERLQEHHWKGDRSVRRRSAHNEERIHLFPPSDDQVEENSLANGLDVTAKAWRVSIFGLLRKDPSVNRTLSRISSVRPICTAGALSR